MSISRRSTRSRARRIIDNENIDDSSSIDKTKADNLDEYLSDISNLLSGKSVVDSFDREIKEKNKPIFQSTSKKFNYNKAYDQKPILKEFDPSTKTFKYKSNNDNPYYKKKSVKNYDIGYFQKSLKEKEQEFYKTRYYKEKIREQKLNKFNHSEEFKNSVTKDKSKNGLLTTGKLIYLVASYLMICTVLFMNEDYFMFFLSLYLPFAIFPLLLIDKLNIKLIDNIGKRIKKEIKNTSIILNDFKDTDDIKNAYMLNEKMNHQISVNNALIDSIDKFKAIDLIVANDKLKDSLNLMESKMIHNMESLK